MAALIQDDRGRYLITRRRGGSHLAGMWEFPGGKREPGESLEEALRRELIEELSATFSVGEKVETVRWPYAERTVVLHFYRCRLQGLPVPQQGQEMQWVARADLAALEFPAADADLINLLTRG